METQISNKPAHILPTGFVYHCEACKIVVPSDAPQIDGGDCVPVVRDRMTHYNHKETIRGRYIMAVAAWGLIHHAAVQSGNEIAITYLRRLHTDHVNHFGNSAAFKGINTADIEAEMKLRPRRDNWAYGKLQANGTASK